MKMYELMPKDGRKSFYGKATVTIDNDGAETPSGASSRGFPPVV